MTHVEGDFLLIGIDIVDINRIREAALRTPRFLNRVFTPQELEYCRQRKDPFPSLAVRFAAKEAVRKLHPAFISGVPWQEVEVRVDEMGKPHLSLGPRAADKSCQAGIADLALSLSHSKTQAVAAVIAGKG